MGAKKIAVISFIASLIFTGVLYFFSYLLPNTNSSIGPINLNPTSQRNFITVVGLAAVDQKNEVASFSAGVSAVNDSKDAAILEVNSSVEKIISAVKNFGVLESDIKTQNLSIFQSEESYWEEDRQKSRPGQWRVNNSVEITLRDISKTSSLADLLAQTGSTNVYGPNFRLDNENQSESILLEQALEDARQKALNLAKYSNGKLGNIISIVEGGSSASPVLKFAEGLGGGGAPIESGTTSVSKAITVTFELL